MEMTEEQSSGKISSLREQHGPFFGEYGGRFMPESLIAAIDELTAAYDEAKADPEFQAELIGLLRDYAGLDRELTVIGADTRIEIWSTQAWDEYLAQHEAEFAELESAEVNRGGFQEEGGALRSANVIHPA